MKILRYIMVIVIALIGILVFLNVPGLAKLMLQTVSAVSWQDWLRYIVGIVIGSLATYLAMKPKKVVIEDDNSDNK